MPANATITTPPAYTTPQITAPPQCTSGCSIVVHSAGIVWALNTTYPASDTSLQVPGFQSQQPMNMPGSTVPVTTIESPPGSCWDGCGPVRTTSTIRGYAMYVPSSSWSSPTDSDDAPEGHIQMPTFYSRILQSYVRILQRSSTYRQPMAINFPATPQPA